MVCCFYSVFKGVSGVGVEHNFFLFKSVFIKESP